MKSEGGWVGEGDECTGDEGKNEKGCRGVWLVLFFVKTHHPQLA